MEESKTEFVKRKKSEKHAQAVRQVMEAYGKTKARLTEDAHGDMDAEPVRGIILDGKFIKWRIRMEPEIEDLFSTIDISKALDMPRERLRDWMVKGFVRPSLPSISKGTIAIFTRDDIVGVALLQKLIDRGFKREAAAEYVQVLVNSVIKSINFICLKSTVKDGKVEYDSYTLHQPASFQLEIDPNGNVVAGPFSPLITFAWEDLHIINMAKLRADVDSALAKLD